MNRDEPLIRPKRLLNAVIVGFIPFFTILVGNDLIFWIGGASVYVTTNDIAIRLPTAVLAFWLTFFVQWGRTRGIDFIRFSGKFSLT
jgi:hypothetical protein